MRATGRQDSWNAVDFAVAFVGLWAQLVGVGLQIVALVVAVVTIVSR